MDLKLWRHVMHVELDIVFHTTQPAWKHLMKRGGAIINTARLGLGRTAHRLALGTP
jgi:NAD(P)-dependent dehydrogenase (short-subunit alcohol dehydrogenase family)